MSSSSEEAEGLLLLGADRLQEPTTAAGSQQLAAVVGGWHRQLQHYRHALGYTEQQLNAAAALLTKAGRNHNTSSSSSSELISVRDCLRYLAAAAVCLPCPPLPTGDPVATRERRQEEFSSLHDILPRAPASLLFSASAALQLLSSQQAFPLVSHFVWWASYAQFETDALLSSSAATNPPQPTALAPKTHASLQRCAWANLWRASGSVTSALTACGRHCQHAGLLAQQLLQLKLQA